MSLPTGIDVAHELATASLAWKKLRRVASYAAIDGWSLAVFGALTLICGGYGSPLGLLISFALVGTGIFEIHTMRQLRRLKPVAVTHLAFNQLVLAAALILYAMVNLIQARQGGSGGGIPKEIQQALAQAGGSSSELNEQLSSAMQMFYMLLIAFAVLVQGTTALYYFSRRIHLARYLEQTPGWIQQMQRERGEISL